MAVAVQPIKEDAIKNKPFTKKRWVVVTGLGVVNPLGFDRIAAEIKSFSVDGWVAPKLLKRAAKFMLAHCWQESISGWDGWAQTSQYLLLVHLATSVYLMQPNHVARAFSSYGDLQDMMLCGGSDAAIIPIVHMAWINLQDWEVLLCVELFHRGIPTRPKLHILEILGGNFPPYKQVQTGSLSGDVGLHSTYSRYRDGGAGVLLLEELEHAKKRGANISTEFLGGSSSSDAYHMIEPQPDVKDKISQIEDVNYVNAHATSTPTGDLKECQVIIQCFGRNPLLRVNSSKSMTGHLLGAAGGKLLPPLR
ncbi:fatty acid biosynthesis 1 [Actinidia rufa]|uniref:beta-ketoacyl-[acyl-carrier-protein] synthase I n=1 Tax=Actinidia rufa TaxID=165716 RepID=A0A7J0G5I6_9ERIC|nr:fatty acid biosynthesis 1 [Actinidia rufa]